MKADVIPLASMSDEEILARLAAIVGESLRVEPARVTIDAALPDLGAESIDIVEITLEVEHAFSVIMPEQTVLALASEVAGEGVFEQDGRLTREGRALLEARLPGIVDARIAAGAPVSELAAMFLRIDVWIRLIRGLLEATPRLCSECGGRLVQGSPARVRCRACAKEFDVPSGDDLGRAWVRHWIGTQGAVSRPETS